MSRRGEIVAPARDVRVAILGGAGRHGSSHRLRLKLTGRYVQKERKLAAW